jgi:aminocarboxymuconate-semialdehyde decarboxylase
VRPDLVAVDNPVPPRDYLGRFWVDSLVHDPDMLRFIVRLFGPDKVALGSDYPFPLGEDRPGTLVESLAELDAATREKLLCRNALEWLGRSYEEFK